MKLLLNFFKSIIVGVWIVVAIFVTICLLSYNEYNITEIGKYTLLKISNNDLKPEFREGDLAIVKRNSDKDIKVGDKIFFYNGTRGNEVYINVGEVTKKETVTPVETTFKIDDKSVSGEYVIGKVNGARIIHYAGIALAIFESRWGFLFLVILPTLFALVYEIFRIVEEVKVARREEQKESQ